MKCQIHECDEELSGHTCMAAVTLHCTASHSERPPRLKVLVKVGHSTSLHSVGAGQILQSEKLEIWDNYHTSKIHLE